MFHIPIDGSLINANPGFVVQKSLHGVGSLPVDIGRFRKQTGNVLKNNVSNFPCGWTVAFFDLAIYFNINDKSIRSGFYQPILQLLFKFKHAKTTHNARIVAFTKNSRLFGKSTPS
jgi:hypothetical protein